MFADATASPWAALRNSPEMRAYSSMPRQKDFEFIARTAFTNQLNKSEPNEQDDQLEHKTDSDKENVSDVETSAEKENVEENVVEEIIEGSVIPMTFTDNESSIGSPVVHKRTFSESTSVDQSSIGSPIIENRCFHDSPAASSGESPLVEKRVIEPITGTVFRKVTLKKRRVDTRHLPPGELDCFSFLDKFSKVQSKLLYIMTMRFQL